MAKFGPNKFSSDNMAVPDTKKLGVADAAMLDKIDKLFACNVGRYVSLPQIVVVGNQSSGKSSVLEGLTNLPFPKDSGLCTRFATQITFKRSNATSTSISVTVIPGKDASSEHIAKCRAWKQTLGNLDAEAFTNVMRKVCTRSTPSDIDSLITGQRCYGHLQYCVSAEDIF